MRWPLKPRLAAAMLAIAGLSLAPSGCSDGPGPDLFFLMYEGTVNITFEGNPAPVEGVRVAASANGRAPVTSTTDASGHFSGQIGRVEEGAPVLFTFDRYPDDDLQASFGGVTSVPPAVGGHSQISIDANLDEGTFQSLPSQSVPFSVALTAPADGGIVHCNPPPALCTFVVEGTCIGLWSSLDAAQQFRLYVLVYPLQPFGGGWFLQLTPATVSRVDGSWFTVAQIGDETSPAATGDTLRLVAVIVSKDEIDQFIASHADPTQSVPTLLPPDFPLHVESAIVEATVER